MSRGAAQAAPGSLDDLDEVLQGLFGSEPSALAPTASVLVTLSGSIIYERDFGSGGLDRVYDLASVTKAALTAPLLMRLVEAGTVRLDDPATTWIREWRGTPFEAVTLRMLFAHRSGLWEWRPIYLHAADSEAAISFVTATEPRYQPGSDRHYSDLGLILAGEVVRRAGGAELDELGRTSLFGPLGLTTLGFNPTGRVRERAVPGSRGDGHEERMIAKGEPHPVPESGRSFDRWRRHPLVGEVNDCNAHHAFGGEAGHAGLFGGARDLARLADAIGGGEVASAATLGEFLREPFDPGQGLIFRTGRLAGQRTFWHSGFTGTRWLGCPALGLAVVLLSNCLMRPGPAVPVDGAWDTLLNATEAMLSKD